MQHPWKRSMCSCAPCPCLPFRISLCEQKMSPTRSNGCRHHPQLLVGVGMEKQWVTTRGNKKKRDAGELQVSWHRNNEEALTSGKPRVRDTGLLSEIKAVNSSCSKEEISFSSLMAVRLCSISSTQADSSFFTAIDFLSFSFWGNLRYMPGGYALLELDYPIS